MRFNAYSYKKIKFSIFFEKYAFYVHLLANATYTDRQDNKGADEEQGNNKENHQDIQVERTI